MAASITSKTGQIRRAFLMVKFNENFFFIMFTNKINKVFNSLSMWVFSPSSPKFKIGHSIIMSNSILMMNQFTISKFSSKMFFHYYSMFRKLPVTYFYNLITILTSYVSSLQFPMISIYRKLTMTFVRTKKVSNTWLFIKSVILNVYYFFTSGAVSIFTGFITGVINRNAYFGLITAFLRAKLFIFRFYSPYFFITIFAFQKLSFSFRYAGAFIGTGFCRHIKCVINTLTRFTHARIQSSSINFIFWDGVIFNHILMSYYSKFPPVISH